jgi:hypothetical protein
VPAPRGWPEARLEAVGQTIARLAVDGYCDRVGVWRSDDRRVVAEFHLPAPEVVPYGGTARPPPRPPLLVPQPLFTSRLRPNVPLFLPDLHHPRGGGSYSFMLREGEDTVWTVSLRPLPWLP